MNAPALYTRHLAVAEALARQFHLPGSAHEDVRQEARIGLWVAVKNWDPDRGSTFRAFASYVIRRRLIAMLKTALAEKHALLTYAVRGSVDDDGEWVAIVDEIAGGDDPAEVVVARERLESLVAGVASLTETERDALRHVVNGGIYRGDKRLDNGVQRARKKLREAIA